MKKNLLLMLLILTFGMKGIAQVCTPDTVTIPGIYPDTIVNLPHAYATAAYGTVIQIRVFTDTSTGSGNVHVTDIEVNSITGLPAGFSYSCNPTNCKFPGGGNGCLYLSGTPTAAQIGTHSLIVNVTLHGKLLNIIPVSQPSQILGYKIKILGAPVADFSGSSTSICKGETVTYTDLSTNEPTSWAWSFPGGTPSTSNLSNPTITYNASGTYNATLTSTNPAGNNTKLKTSYLTVNATPSAAITVTGSLSICAGSSVLFTANNGTGYTYQWLKNGIDINGATSQTYQASAAGNYKVKVTKPNGCFKISSPKTVSVINVTATNSAGGPTTFCSGGNVMLSSNTGPGLTYQWKKNGTNITGATGATYQATVSGAYKVTVTNAGGCSKVSPAVNVTVNALPSGNVTASGPLTFCAGGSVTLTAVSGTNFSYQWKKNGNNISGATQVSYTANTAGTYKVNVSKPNGCSKISVSKNVIINCKNATAGGNPSGINNTSLFPNPSSGEATLKFDLTGDHVVDIDIYDMQGKLLSHVATKNMVAGPHEQPISNIGFPAGFYIIQISSPNGNEKIKMMVSKK